MWTHANYGERKDAIVTAKYGRTLEDDMGDEFAVLAHLDIGPDYAEGTDGARLWYASGWIDEGGGMYAHEVGA